MAKKKEVIKEEKAHICLPGQLHLFETNCSLCKDDKTLEVIKEVATEIEKPRIIIEINDLQRYSKITIPKNSINSIEFINSKSNNVSLSSTFLIVGDKEILIFPNEGQIVFL